MTSGHIKSKKLTQHVLLLAVPCNTNESAMIHPDKLSLYIIFGTNAGCRCGEMESFFEMVHGPWNSIKRGYHYLSFGMKNRTSVLPSSGFL